MLKVVARVLVDAVLVAIVLFAAAGTLAWLRAWILLAVLLLERTATAVTVFRVNPDLLRERARLPLRGDQPLADKLVLLAFMATAFVGVPATNLSTVAVSWSARLNGTWKFTNKVDAQLFSNYRAPTKTEGGSSLAFVNTSLGGRYKVWGDQGNISVRVNDPFRLSKFGYRTANGQIVELSRRYFSARAVYVSINRNFGQALRLRPKSESEDVQTGPPPP